MCVFQLRVQKQIFNAFVLIFSVLLNLKKNRVGLETPTIEVRFENLNVEAEIYVGGRALPTILNFGANIFEVIHLLDYVFSF